jgi:hypothetical protein
MFCMGYYQQISTEVLTGKNQSQIPRHTKIHYDALLTYVSHATKSVSRPALKPTQPPNRRVPGSLSSSIKRSRREAYNSPPFSAEVKNAWSYTSVIGAGECSNTDTKNNL